MDRKIHKCKGVGGKRRKKYSKKHILVRYCFKVNMGQGSVGFSPQALAIKATDFIKNMRRTFVKAILLLSMFLVHICTRMFLVYDNYVWI